jgi:hypothetical protein
VSVDLSHLASKTVIVGGVVFCPTLGVFGCTKVPEAPKMLPRGHYLVTMSGPFLPSVLGEGEAPLSFPPASSYLVLTAVAK